MKSYNFKWAILFLLVITYPALPQSNFKIWTETTVQDFSDSQLNNVVILSNQDGEVQLQHPLVKTINDYNDDSFFRHKVKDSLGNFVRTWVQGGNVYVKKYAVDGKGITKTIRVNEENGSAEYSGSSIAVLNDGTYIVVWTNTAHIYTTEDADIRGQIFVNDSVRVGDNFKINDDPNSSNYEAKPIANNKEHNFYLFYSYASKIQVQKRDVYGNKIGETALLNPQDSTYTEYEPRPIADETGYWIAWDGSEEGNSSSWGLDLYLRHYKYDGTPLGDIILVNDNILKMQSNAGLCLDNNSNLFVAWIDERDEKLIHDYDPPGFNIYGQIFNPNGEQIGSNVKINAGDPSAGIWEPEVEFVSNEFIISWPAGNKTYITKWKYDPKFDGEMISSIYDGSPKGCSFNEISWDYQPNNRATLRFQIRSANTTEQLNNSPWSGKISSSDFYTNNTGEKINDSHNGHRYIQYKVFFNSDDGSSPILKSVSIKYSTNDSIPPMSPLNLTVVDSHASIILSWQPNSEKDVKEYKIYRGIEKNKYDENWNRTVSNSSTSYVDSSVQTGIKYFYVVTAIDSSRNESVYSNETFGTAYAINIYVSINGSRVAS